MRKRYPRTLFTLVGIAVIAAVFAAEVLWHPFAYIFLGLMVMALFAGAVREDRKDRR